MVAVVQVARREGPVGVGLGDLPPVTVLHEVRGRDAQPAVVLAGDDHVTSRGVVVVRQRHLAVLGGPGAGDPRGSGAAVQVGDELPGGSQHDRVQARCPVGSPGLEDLLAHGGHVPDVDPAPVQVEPDRLGAPLAQREGRGRLGGVVEAHHLRQFHRPVLGLDVAQDTPSADGRELLVVAHQTHAGATLEGVVHDALEDEGVGHPGLVDDQQGVLVHLVPPLGVGAGSLAGQQLVVLRQGVGVGAGRLAQLGGGRGAGRQADDVPPTFAPGPRQGGHGRGLAGSGRGDRQLGPGPRGGHLADQVGLPLVEGDPVGVGLQQGDVDRLGGHAATVGHASSRDQVTLGVQHVGGGEQVAPGHGEHRGTIGAAQLLGLTDRVRVTGDRGGQVQHTIDQQTGGGVDLRRCQTGLSQASLGLGRDVPPLPGRAPFLQGREDLGGGLLEPLAVDLRGGGGLLTGQGADHHLVQSRLPAAHLQGLLVPLGALLVDGARLVLLVAGLQRRLLGQLHRLDRGGRPPV